MPNVLDPEYHERLILKLDAFAADAAIHPRFIKNPLGDFGNDAIREWLRHFRQHTDNGSSGLVLVGPDPVSVDRMSAIAGALLRNFIRSRVVTLHTMLEAEVDSMLDWTCLLIPNFYVPKSEGGGVASWKVTELHDMLVERRLAGKQTILSVQDLAGLSTDYGVVLQAFIEANMHVAHI